MRNIKNINIYGDIIFTLVFAIYAFIGTIFTSVYIRPFFNCVPQMGYAIEVLLIGGLYFNITVYKVYNLKKFALHLAITAFIYIVYLNTHNLNFVIICFMLLAMHKINLNKLCRIALTTNVTLTAAIIFSTIFGLGPDNIHNRIGTLFLQRHSLGFLEPNFLGAFLLEICILTTYLRWKDLKIIDNIFLFTVLYLITFIANSRTSSILLILLIILVNLNKFWIKKPLLKFNYILANATVLLAPAITFIMTKLYCSSVPFALWSDEILSYRFRNICYSLATNNITWFGTKMHITTEMNLIANLYGAFLLKFGIITLLLFLAGYILVLRKAYLYKNIPLMIIITLTMLQGISDYYPIMIHINFSILTFSCLLNNKDLLIENNLYT